MVTSFQGMSTAVTGDLGPMAPKPLEKGDGGALQEADRFERGNLPTMFTKISWPKVLTKTW